MMTLASNHDGCSPSEGDALSICATGASDLTAWFESEVPTSSQGYAIPIWPRTAKQRQNFRRTMGEVGWTDSSLLEVIQVAGEGKASHRKTGVSIAILEGHRQTRLRQWHRIHLLARLLKRIDVAEDPAGCWGWTGAASGAQRYGRVKIDGKLILPHRAMAFLAGKIERLSAPERIDCVLHTCDNPSCCSPLHLRKGTLSDNMRDCASKGRLGPQSRG